MNYDASTLGGNNKQVKSIAFDLARRQRGADAVPTSVEMDRAMEIWNRRKQRVGDEAETGRIRPKAAEEILMLEKMSRR